MQKVLFITNIDHLRISSDLDKGDKVADKFLITNNKSIIEKLITSIFHKIAGNLEVSYLMNSGAVAYSIQDFEPFSNNDEAMSVLVDYLLNVKMFFHMLWFVKDNAADIDYGFLEYPYKTGFSANVSRNAFTMGYTNALGEFTETIYSREELRIARHMFKDFSQNIILNTQSVAEERTGRFSRAFYFLQAARSNSDMGVKVSNYCTCFEALFSNDARELSHKLSERIACFLEDEFSERSNVFHSIKKAYNIRSRVVHGTKGSKKLYDIAKESSINCDNILRKVFTKILKTKELYELFNKTGKDNTIEDYFISLVLDPAKTNNTKV